MNAHASVRCSGERDNRKVAVQQRSSWYRWLLVCVAVIFTVCGALPGEAVNGEPVGAEGLHRTAACTTDFTISCDDRPQSGVVACHMRGPTGDEGFAIDACVDGRVTIGAAQSEFLEEDVTITATDFGEVFCGKGSDGFDFCVICDTFNDPGASIGASHCVKIINNQQTVADGTCGAFNVSNDISGACLSATQDLQQSFSDPQLGFTIGFNGSDAGQPEAKDLVLCDRAWQCIDDRSVPLASEAEQIQEQQTHALINTPCCIRLSSGRYYCSSTLTTSATCK